MTRVVVTGASGFIGKPLTAVLSEAGYQVRALYRSAADFSPNVEAVPAPDLREPVKWRALVADADFVIHLAGIAHAGGVDGALYERVNHRATAELAAAAAQAGTKRLVFLSSIRAQSGPSAGHVLTEADDAEPSDLYGRSKLAAENAITEAGVAFTILRPVLVYGPGAKGNLASLQRLSASPWPLPLGAFENRRSLLGIDNLIAAILLAIENPVCANQIYIAADPKPLTLAEIVAALRDAAGRSPRLVAVPPMLLKAALTAAGKSEAWQRLGGELVADPAKLIAAGWHPPVETRAGLAAMVRAARG